MIFKGKVAVLNSTRSGHTGIVKGVSWDPIGKFLASQSADRTVKIWAIDGWDCVKTIVEPFAEVCSLCLLLFTYLYILYCP